MAMGFWLIFSVADVINLTLETADAWALWHYPDFRDLKDIAKVLQADGQHVGFDHQRAVLAQDVSAPVPEGAGRISTFAAPSFMYTSCGMVRLSLICTVIRCFFA